MVIAKRKPAGQKRKISSDRIDAAYNAGVSSILFVRLLIRH
jgi:hypothetical protein